MGFWRGQFGPYPSDAGPGTAVPTRLGPQPTAPALGSPAEYPGRPQCGFYTKVTDLSVCPSTRGINSSLMKPPEYKLEFFEFKLSLLSLLGLY